MENTRFKEYQERCKEYKRKARVKKLILFTIFSVVFILLVKEHCYGLEGFRLQSKFAELVVRYFIFAGFPLIAVFVNISNNRDIKVRDITFNYIKETEGEEVAQRYREKMFREDLKQLAACIALRGLLAASERKEKDK